MSIDLQLPRWRPARRLLVVVAVLASTALAPARATGPAPARAMAAPAASPPVAAVAVATAATAPAAAPLAASVPAAAATGPLAEPRVAAGAVVLADETTGQVLFQRNPRAPRAMASTTKVMTALLALERLDLRQPVVIGRASCRERVCELV